MFQTAAGVTIPYPEKLSEQYVQDGNTITLNLSFEKLADFVHSFYAELDEPLFLAVHPDAESDEVWTEEELFVQKYKVLSIYSETVQRFEKLLTRYDVTRTTKLITAWDTFSEAHPGSAERLEIAGQTIPDMIKELQKIGMYKAN